MAVANSIILIVKGTYKMLFGVAGVRSKSRRVVILIWLFYPVPKARTDSNPVFLLCMYLGAGLAAGRLAKTGGLRTDKFYIANDGDIGFKEKSARSTALPQRPEDKVALNAGTGKKKILQV